MSNCYINLDSENIADEHLCCAISDKKHQRGVDVKRAWLSERISEGHVFRKLDAKGKIFIEYAPLELSWVPIEGDNYIYIYCFWVSGSYKNKGHGRELLEYCIEDARKQGRSGVCVLSSSKKMPFLSDKKYLQKYGFETVDRIGEQYELMALSFNDSKPAFANSARNQQIDSKELTIYYGQQCPYNNASNRMIVIAANRRVTAPKRAVACHFEFHRQTAETPVITRLQALVFKCNRACFTNQSSHI